MAIDCDQGHRPRLMPVHRARIARARTHRVAIAWRRIDDVDYPAAASTPPRIPPARSPSPSKAGIETPAAAGIRHIAPLVSRNPRVSVARGIHPVPVVIRVPVRIGGFV